VSNLLIVRCSHDAGCGPWWGAGTGTAAGGVECGEVDGVGL